jgi:hypothetical protein
MARRVALAAATMLFMAVAAPVLAAETVEAETLQPAADAQPDGWNPDTGIYEMVFPIDDPHSYGDTWGACRDGCSRSHEGTDIFAAKMTDVYAAAAGTVGWVNDTQGGDCCAMSLEHDDGWTTYYIHLNNDTPGTDDGQGWGFAPGITSGVHVEAGQLIGYVGDSGNAESTSAHIHFELHQPDGTKINPYPHLRAAEAPDGGVPGLPALVSYRVDDGPSHDGTGNDSKGNDDGLAQCGETIELYLTLQNDGEGTLSGLSASLSVPDPFVDLLYNTKSSYPNIAPGDSAENPKDWDLKIASDTPGGHHFTASFSITADVGGPWLIEVPIPIECGVDITSPQVAAVDPHHGAYSVPVDTNVVATFNEPVDPLTVTPDTFLLENAELIAGAITVAPDGLTATFDPDADLEADTVFAASLTDGITDLAGNPLVATAVSFSTGDIAPGSIVDVSYRVDDGPSHDGTGNDSVGNNDGVARCGETIELYITVRNEGGLVISGLSGAFSESDPYVRLLYNINSPYPDLAPGATGENLGDWDIKIDTDTPIGHEFIATITFSVLHPVTLALQPIDSTVDVAIPIECSPPRVTGVTPDDDAVDVSVGTSITATFSKRIDSASVTTDSFHVDNGGPVAGSVTVAGNRRSATFTPDENLDHETEYTVTLDAGVTDRAGNPIPVFTSTFTTEDPDLTPPEVTSISPFDAAVDVAVGSDVVVTFSEPVDPGTVTTDSFGVANGGPVAGSVSVAGDALSATFAPDTDLAFSTGYSVAVGAAVTDTSGNPLVPFAASFTTQDPIPDPGVPVLASVRIDDGPSHDGTGNDSKGNNDGVAQCGETIELYITAMNAGELGLTGLSGRLLESDPFVTLLYNTTSAYPNLGSGASAENPLDWDLRILSSAPDAHEFDFTIRYTANEGGPWDVDVTVPIGCGGGDPDPDPGVPVLVSVRVDDGPSHDGTGNDSKGNNDGLAQCGETIELYVTLRNNGGVALTGVSGLLLESDPKVTLLYNTSASYPNLGAGATAENPRDWDLRIAADDATGDFDFTIRVTANEGGPWDIAVSVPIDCGGPPADPGLPSLVSVRVDDGPSHDGTGNDSKGNNDGAAQCGETIEVYVRIRNEGDSVLTGLSGLLLESDPFIDLLYNTTSSYPNLAPGADAENPKDWDLKVSPDTPDDHEFTFTIRYSADGGEWDVEVTITIDCP